MLLTESQVIQRIRDTIAVTEGGQKAFADRYGVSEQLICDLLKRRRKLGPKILAAVGLRKIVRFEPLGKDAA